MKTGRYLLIAVVVSIMACFLAAILFLLYHYGFMGFWWFMFACDLLIPATMIMAGRMMWKHCPRDINGMVGYRTSRSMKNADTWKFANEYCGKLWWKLGWILTIPSIAVQLFSYGKSTETVGIVGGILCTVQTVILVIAIFPTELALKRSFTETGERR